jgi:deoxyribodipyrimidine photo-lyase
MRTIVWFRGKDLRLADHAPLHRALAAGEVLPLFVLDPFFFAPQRAAALPHRMQFLLDSLAELATAIAARGSRLLLAAGRSVELVPRLADAWRADRVLAQRWVEPFGRERDRRIAQVLGSRFTLLEGETLVPPGTLRTAAGKPFAVFSPFARAFRGGAVIGSALAAPRSLPPIPPEIRHSDAELPALADLGIRRNPAVQPGGEQAARSRLVEFLLRRAAAYPEQRNRLDLPGTSRLSADLKFGTLSVREVWTAVENAQGRDAAHAFLNELLWREFAHSTLWDRPALLEEPFREDFRGFPWRDDEAAWQAWTTGHTGYPVVDAAARQLLGEGFVHNRARMIAASFLTKHLLVDYRRGEAHYLRYLTDGDWAQNNAGWQWSAGCGCDAQPYFRIFNPMTQGATLDPEGAYVRRWVPELAELELPWLHQPWLAPPLALAVAGVRLGDNYPWPIVEHAAARERFLATAAGHLKRRS